MAAKVVIQGACGRMGKALIRCILEEKVPGLELVGAVDVPEVPGIGTDAGVMAGCAAAGINVISDLAEVGPGADVIIEFSAPVATAANASRIAEWGTAWVIGTTGLNEEQIAAVEATSEKTAVVLSGNMSLGINLLCHLVEIGARSLKGKGYDIEVLESHHNLKKDSPSGTALMLGQAAADGYGWNLKEVQVDGRTGLPGERPEKEIGFHAIRGGDIVGDHTVMMAGVGELLELSHRATSRDVFAIGALQAALWVAEKEPKLYTMKDAMKHVLGL
ncbi:4-hydroxy-tetrahydrodipicolinate reductase [Pontiellaceae bacterium B12219]|nr:4-hydroxy-tetrahydrodipicolinate reductase [Pontiellaceae bacterium B12219]